MENNRILIVDDDGHICELLTLYLKSAGFESVSCHSVTTAMQHFLTEPFDLVLLDVMLPDGMGFDTCRAMKDKKGEIPIIMITARDMLDDKIQGFHCGADDYIVKPFEPAEVIARIRARLKKTGVGQRESNVITIGDITVSMDAYQVTKGGVSVLLKPKEVQLLFFLMRNRNIVFSRDTLLQKVWNYDFAGDTRTVDVHIKSLRQKLINDDAPFEIKTVWGVGYKLEER